MSKGTPNYPSITDAEKIAGVRAEIDASIASDRQAVAELTKATEQIREKNRDLLVTWVKHTASSSQIEKIIDFIAGLKA